MSGKQRLRPHRWQFIFRFEFVATSAWDRCVDTHGCLIGHPITRSAWWVSGLSRRSENSPGAEYQVHSNQIVVPRKANIKEKTAKKSNKIQQKTVNQQCETWNSYAFELYLRMFVNFDDGELWVHKLWRDLHNFDGVKWLHPDDKRRSRYNYHFHI